MLRRGTAFLLGAMAAGPIALPGVRASADGPTIQAGRLRAALRIDGRLDEEPWRRATFQGGFQPIVPGRGAAARTAVAVLFDDECLYVGFRCEGPDRGRMAAKRAARDCCAS